MSSPPKDDLEFLGLLMRGNARQILANTANALILLDQDHALKDLLAFDELHGRGVITRSPPPKQPGAPEAPGPYPRPWGDQDVQMILAYLQRVYTGAFSRGVVEAALIAVAKEHPYHPIRNYLDGLTWDGEERLNTWLAKAFGTPDSDYTRAVAAKFLIAAVRRVREPGCKFDYLVIFEGLQGLGKSRALALLFGAQWFTDSLPPDLASRDSLLALNGIWAAEFPEIDQIIRADVETVKAFLSRGRDRYRLPYGRGFIEVLRQCVLCGTSNSEDYLRDVTGNRRFWPIVCLLIDINWIIANRDQLWAEAAAREAADEALWLDDKETAAEAVVAQAARLPEDTWEDVLDCYLWDRWSTTGDKIECSTGDALYMGLGISRERQDRKTTLRVCQCLRTIGWRQGVLKSGVESRRAWRPSPAWIKLKKTPP